MRHKIRLTGSPAINYFVFIAVVWHSQTTVPKSCRKSSPNLAIFRESPSAIPELLHKRSVVFFHRADGVTEELRYVVRACPSCQHVHREGVAEPVRVCVGDAGAPSECLHALVDAFRGERFICSREQQHPVLEIRLAAITLGFQGEQQLLGDRKQHALLSLLREPVYLRPLPILPKLVPGE
jgi:hypothetical protein